MIQSHNNQQAADLVGVHRETAQKCCQRWLEAVETLTGAEIGGMDVLRMKQPCPVIPFHLMIATD